MIVISDDEYESVKRLAAIVAEALEANPDRLADDATLTLSDVEAMIERATGETV